MVHGNMALSCNPIFQKRRNDLVFGRDDGGFVEYGKPPDEFG